MKAYENCSMISYDLKHWQYLNPSIGVYSFDAIVQLLH